MRHQISIYDDIGFDTNAKSFSEKLAAIPSDEPIDLFISSNGGDVFDALAIYSQIKRRKNVDTYVDGLAASAASIIMQAGERRFISDVAKVMIHNAYSFTVGDSEAMKKEADLLDMVNATIRDIYKSRSSASDEELQQMMQDETWIDASAAIANGFADEIVTTLQIAAKLKKEKKMDKEQEVQNEQEVKNEAEVTVDENQEDQAQEPTQPMSDAAEILDAFGDEFGAKAIRNGWSMEQAQTKFIDHLKNRIDKLEKDISEKVHEANGTAPVPVNPQDSKEKTRSGFSENDIRKYAERHNMDIEQARKLLR